MARFMEMECKAKEIQDKDLRIRRVKYWAHVRAKSRLASCSSQALERWRGLREFARLWFAEVRFRKSVGERQLSTDPLYSPLSTHAAFVIGRALLAQSRLLRAKEALS